MAASRRTESRGCVSRFSQIRARIIVIARHFPVSHGYQLTIRVSRLKWIRRQHDENARESPNYSWFDDLPLFGSLVNYARERVIS